jgi:hypothetical protein
MRLIVGFGRRERQINYLTRNYYEGRSFEARRMQTEEKNHLG